MENGRRKTLDSRYNSLYSNRPKGNKGNQLSAKETYTPPADRKGQYDKPFSNNKG